jgi:hypothetical protein
MAIKTVKKNTKRLSKSQRIHVRRVKQAARKDGAIYQSLKVGMPQQK